MTNKPITYGRWNGSAVTEQVVVFQGETVPSGMYPIVVDLQSYDATKYREVDRVDSLENGQIVRRPVLELIPEVVPTEVTPYQARVALLKAGLLEQIEYLMQNPSVPKEARLAWEYATVIRRESPFIAVLGPALGLSDKQIDALFVAAAQIE